MSIVNVNNLSIKFGTNTVVDQISFRVEKGEVLAIVGESGSGKSVTAATLGWLQPESAIVSGSVSIFDQDITNASDRKRRQLRGNKISYIFQEPMTALNPLHKIQKQIAESITLHQGLSGEALEQAINKSLEQVGLTDFDRIKSSYPHELSGGQRQRVVIAMALANRPKLLIADEPTTALDATLERQILDLLIDLQKELGLTLVFITHDLRILSGLADRVLVMKSGKIVEEGNADQVLTTPTQPYTQQLINAANYDPRTPFVREDKPLARTNQLCVTYGKPAGFLRKSSEFVALKGIDLQVRSGEALGLVGESGSGKSTIGRAMMKLVESTGEIEVDGHQIQTANRSDIRTIRRSVQMVFQDPFGSLSPRMTVGSIIGEGLSIHEPKVNIAERVHETMLEVGLDPSFSQRYPHEFSGGQRQRISIARAIIMRPKLIILDEPTSALDRTVQTQIVELLINLQNKYNLGYLFISHDFAVVRAICHSVIVLKDGEIVEKGSTKAVFESPQKPYSQKLVSAAL